MNLTSLTWNLNPYSELNNETQFVDYIYEICDVKVDEDLKNRAINKIDSKIIYKNIEIDDWNKKLDRGVFGLEDEQIQGVIDVLHKELDVFLYIKSRL